MNEGDESYGPHAMANTLCVCDCVLKGAKDGDKIKATIEGTLIEHEGKRYVAVQMVDGEPVEEMDNEDYGPDMNSENKSEMDSEDALMNFMKSKY